MLILLMILVLSGCSQSTLSSDLPNHSFERGTLEGWTTTNELSTLISNQTTFDGRRKHMKDGVYFLSTKNQSGTFEISSTPFILKGLGKISFLIAGDTSEGVEVILKDHLTQETLLHAQNLNYDGSIFIDNFVRIIWDAEDYLGKKLMIVIKDSSDTGYILADAFDIYVETEDEVIHYMDDVLLRSGIKTSNLKMSAEYYINLYKTRIDLSTKYDFHVTGEMGWINDPNGFVYFQDAYHLFYQHHPYSTQWGPMHWGHVKSHDLIKWDYLPIALAPHVLDAGGGAAFSGSAIDINGELYLMYTENWIGYQHQVIAKSSNGIDFQMINEGLPVIDASNLPFYSNPIDFRDPKIFLRNDTYYAVIGSRQINQFGQVLLFKSNNLIDWTHVGPVIQGNLRLLHVLGYMFECPDLFELNGKDVLIMSPQQIPGHRNNFGTVYVTGSLNVQTGSLEAWSLSEIEEIDYGFDFYAPQTMIDPQGRRIMVAWMQSWNRSPMTGHLGWAGAMTIPRVISLDASNKLIQYPVEEIEQYRTQIEHMSVTRSGKFDTGYAGNVSDMEIKLYPGNGKSGVTLFGDSNGKGVHVYYENGLLYLNRTERMNGRHVGDFYNVTQVPVTLNTDGSLDLRILIDKYSVEVFINGGRKAITATIFQSSPTQTVWLFSDNETRFDVNYWKLDIK